MPRYVEFYMQGRLHLDELISQRISLEQINDAFEVLETGDIARRVIVFACAQGRGAREGSDPAQPG